MDQPLDICQGVTNTELSGILYPFTLGTVIYIVLYDVHSLEPIRRTLPLFRPAIVKSYRI